MEKKFYQTERGAVVSHGMHDHSNASCTMGSCLNLIKMTLKIVQLMNMEYFKLNQVNRRKS